jgi:putative transposase
MIEVNPSKLSLVRQCQLVHIARSSYYYQPKSESEFNLKLMRLIDAQYLRTPWYGSRQMSRHLRRQGYRVNRKRIRRLMRKMGLVAVAPAPNTSRRHPQHAVYPYLLRGMEITQADQVWCADVTYLPMAHGFLYLVAIMDWRSRRVLSWQLSNTLEADFCVEALQEAIEQHGCPSIFNTDQGSQFTSTDWIDELKANGIKISMDGKGRWMDNVFIERLWRSLKYECVYLNAFDNMQEAKEKLNTWINYYNHERPHSSLNDQTPNEVYEGIEPLSLAA